MAKLPPKEDVTTDKPGLHDVMPRFERLERELRWWRLAKVRELLEPAVRVLSGTGDG